MENEDDCQGFGNMPVEFTEISGGTALFIPFSGNFPEHQFQSSLWIYPTQFFKQSQGLNG